MPSTPARAVRATRWEAKARATTRSRRAATMRISARRREDETRASERDAREGEDRANARGSDAAKAFDASATMRKMASYDWLSSGTGALLCAGILPLARTERGDGAGRGVRGDDRVGGD